MGNGENPLDPTVRQTEQNAPQEKGVKQKEAREVQPEPMTAEEEEQLKQADQSNEAVNAQLKDAAVQEKVQKTPAEKLEQGQKQTQMQKGGKTEEKQRIKQKGDAKDKIPKQEQKEEKGGEQNAAKPPPFTDFDQLTCEQVQDATSTTHIPQSNDTTQTTVNNAEQIAQQETPSWGTVALNAIRDTTIGPFTGGWWGKRFDAFGEIWGQKSPYGDSWIGTTFKVLHTIRTVTETIGSIAGTIGLWTSLLSLVGLIPGLQPIGAALATVAQICTLVSFICSAISLAINAISLVINAIRWLSNKVFGTEQGVDFGSLMLNDVTEVVTAGISLALTNASGTATAFRQGLKQGVRQAFSSIGQKFSQNVTQDVTQNTAKVLSIAGAGNLAKRLMPDVGQGVRGVVSQIYKQELQRLASTQAALGIPRAVSYKQLFRKGYESAAQTGRSFIQGVRRITQLIRANRLNRQMQRAGIPVPNRFIRENSAEMRQIVMSGVKKTVSGVTRTGSNIARFTGKVVKETVTGLTRTDESALGNVASSWIMSGVMSPVLSATAQDWIKGSKEPSRIQSAVPQQTSTPADTSSIDSSYSAASQKTAEQLNSPGSINAPELPLPPPEIDHSPTMLKNAAEEKEYLKGAEKEMEKKKEDAKSAQKENEQIKGIAEKWEEEGKGRQSDFLKMSQKMGEKEAELQTDKTEIEKGEQKAGEIKDKGMEIKEKGESAKSSTNVERAKYPENPSLLERIKRFFLEGVVGRFNSAIDSAKQTAMNIIMKGIEGAMGGDEIKQKLAGKKEEVKGSEKKLEKGKQEMQKGEKQAKEMEQQGAQERMKADKNIQEAKFVENEADKSLMEIKAQQKAVEKEEAQVKAKMEAYKSAYGPTIDYIKEEAVQQKGGAKVEDKLNVKLQGEAKVIQEESVSAMQKAKENISEAEEKSSVLMDAASSDAYDSLGSGAEAIIPEIQAQITEIVSAFMSGEQERISRLSKLMSDAAKFGADKPSENTFRELAGLRDSLKEEITAMSLSKDELMKALHEGGMEIFNELAEIAAQRKQQGAQDFINQQ